MRDWWEWIGAELQDDGTVLCCGRGPKRPYVIEVESPEDAAVKVQEVLRRQFREEFSVLGAGGGL